MSNNILISQVEHYLCASEQFFKFGNLWTYALH